MAQWVNILDIAEEWIKTKNGEMSAGNAGRRKRDGYLKRRLRKSS